MSTDADGVPPSAPDPPGHPRSQRRAVPGARRTPPAGERGAPGARGPATEAGSPTSAAQPGAAGGVGADPASPRPAPGTAPPPPVRVAVRRLPHGAGLPLPAYMSPEASGCDLAAAVAESVCIQPGERTLVPTGFALALPAGYEAQVRPRSGLALNAGVTCLNSPGTIDADYRGEVKVLLINLGRLPFVVRRGERIAQLVVQPVTRAAWVESDTLPPTARAEGGFGHTGR